jgi:hypothetical protein
MLGRRSFQGREECRKKFDWVIYSENSAVRCRNRTMTIFDAA